MGGFQHETNTFMPTRASLDRFTQPDAWPGLLKGDELLCQVKGMNLPITGFADAASAAGHKLVPLSWCSAVPSGPVTDEAFEAVSSLLLKKLADAGPVDAVYLDLHGAMVTESYQDGDGVLLQSIRSIVGNKVPLVASLDFHANISEAMIEAADILTVYRTYPHVDMADTGRRTAALIDRLLCGEKFYAAWHRFPFLIALVWQCSMTEPTKSVLERVETMEAGGRLSIGFAPGFPLADVTESGPCVIVYAADQEEAKTALALLTKEIDAVRNRFCGKLYSPSVGVREALRLVAKHGGPVVLADSADNPGAGGTGDTVGLLDALLDYDTEGAAFGVLSDSQTAKQAHAAGRGRKIEVSLGAKAADFGEAPVTGTFHVESLGSGRFIGTGPFYGGASMNLGPMVCLRRKGVRVLISSRPQQAADQAMFRHLGIEPAEQRILALKSSVHFRADFGPLARDILIIDGPGANTVDLATLTYRHREFLPP